MLSVGKKSSLSAVGIDFIVEKNNVLRELSSFVSIRGLGGNLGSGLALNEEMEVLIPDSKQIRTLALDNIWGISDDDKLDIEISGYGRTWKISIDFGISGAEPSILGFNIEYPPGSVVYTNKRIRPAKSGLNLLKLGNDYYDYDDDANVEDIVDVSGEEVKFRVTRMDISAAAIFVRP